MSIQMDEIEVTESNASEGFRQFEFHGTDRWRNNKLIELMPVNPGFAYCAIWTEGFVRKDGEELRLSSFYEMFGCFGVEATVDNLQALRMGGDIVEGEHRLDQAVGETLLESAPASVWGFIRSHDPELHVWRVNLRDYLASDDLLYVLPQTFGEFEVADDHSQWYLRIRDDESVMFLAGAENIVERLAASNPGVVMKVPGIMIY